jgi:signal transduction histidine kinase
MGRAAAPESQGDSRFETSALDRALERSTRLPLKLSEAGWRLQLLALLLLAALSTTLLLTRAVASSPHLGGDWRATAAGLTLRASHDPALVPHVGQLLTLISVGQDGGDQASVDLPADTLWLHPSTRWQPVDALRARQGTAQYTLAQALSNGSITLHFSTATGLPAGSADVTPSARGWAGLGATYYALMLGALGLVLLAVVTLLAQPRLHNALFAGLCLAQALHLALVALQALPGLGEPARLVAVDGPLRTGLDLATVAALLHVATLHPRKLPAAPLVGWLAWGGAALWLFALWRGLPGADWAWLQGGLLLGGASALLLIHRTARAEPNPYTALLRRLVALSLAGAALLTGVLWWAPVNDLYATTRVVSTLWPLLAAVMLALLPLLVRVQPLLRELLVLGGLAALALGCQMLLRAAGLGPLAALSLAIVFTLVLYALARSWLLRHLLGTGPSTEHIFEHLYRAAREVQAQPARHAAVLARVLHELFEPLSLAPLDRAPSRARVLGGGAAMVVPVGLQQTSSDEVSEPGERRPAVALSLRFARRGRRVFTLDDARLADRVVDQLKRAVAYDRAVERGRAEERQRIAQDLHDDIGARLLTLMYQAPNAEMEDYLRHTLQDLKTLTRGLAASEHRLSHAAAEWKADLTQRLTAAQVELAWSVSSDRDLKLSVVQWSALTRVLRELASNAMAHAQATRLDIQFNLQRRQLLLLVSDDGRGRDPQSWSHGLGLGGVRKRVKLLGGTVQWREGQPRGIVCEVRVPDFGAPSDSATP